MGKIVAIHGVAYPERLAPSLKKLDEWVECVVGPVMRRVRGSLFHRERFINGVAEAGEEWARLGDAELQTVAQALRVSLVRDGFHASVVAKAFALIRETAKRTIGQCHFDAQLLGGWVLLTGRVAEMETGEGKTLTATLPACTAALAGLPVHIVTVNDYLAERDAKAMAPVYQALGLTVGLIVQGLSPESRRAAYACDVTYCTNKELVFDYLKDRLVTGQSPSHAHFQLERLAQSHPRAGQVLLRGLQYAIVDEADSVLIDEARTPLIIAGVSRDATERDMYAQALALAATLEQGGDFQIDQRERTVRLTPDGRQRLAELAKSLGPVWQGSRRRESFIEQALTAIHLFQRERHYLVQDDRIQIIDEYTGRIMPDRSWERGLHQMIEVKEQCYLSHRQDTLARISYQRFFRRYLRLAGMTGTAGEVAGELWSVYRLGVVRIPTNRPLARRAMPDLIYATAETKWQAVVQSVAQMRQKGRAVLVGTRTVAASDHLSKLLTQEGIPHHVLNARQDHQEAAVIAEAAESGRITVATNMAGRGTDIHPTSRLVAAGGLHVLATERHDAHRIDRQLFGRCGRQGDPGSYQAIVSLDDELITAHAGPLARRVAISTASADGRVASWAGGLAFHVAQRRAERLHAGMRRAVLKMDEQLDSALAFAGRAE